MYYKWYVAYPFIAIVVVLILRKYLNLSMKRIFEKSPTVKEFYLSWNGESNSIFYREILPKGEVKLDVLLLHGMKFSSKNWLDIKTFDILASNGYHVVALDLPGYGRSTYELHTGKSEFLFEFIKNVGLNNAVIISPSMSGRFSLPYLAAGKPSKAFVAIAVAGTEDIDSDDFKKFPPTLIFRGSRDVGLGARSTETLRSYLSNYRYKEIRDAGHACYLDKPEVFHDSLLNYLDFVNKT